MASPINLSQIAVEVGQAFLSAVTTGKGSYTTDPGEFVEPVNLGPLGNFKIEESLTVSITKV